MKRFEAIQNLINCVNEHNFIDLFYVADLKTDKRASICFLKKDDAISHMKILKTLYKREYYISTTCVYCA